MGSAAGVPLAAHPPLLGFDPLDCGCPAGRVTRSTSLAIVAPMLNPGMHRLAPRFMRAPHRL
jgi:hypothetical protein